MRHAKRKASVRAFILAAACAIPAGHILAHELTDQALPDQPGWRIGAGLAGVMASANNDWPMPRWRGVLTNGQAARDQRGAPRIEHGVLDLAVRAHPSLGAQFTLGLHDRERPHLEAARLEVNWLLGQEQFIASAGRNTVSMGNTIDQAGHLDRYSQVPLAKRALLNKQWIDDGMTLAWRRPEQSGLQLAELGLWSARFYPGGPHGPLAPTVHVAARWGAYSVDGFAAHLEPHGRGAHALASGPQGHTHSVPDCRQSVTNLVCFDGQVDLLATSVRWLSADERWTLSAAAMLRSERGRLYSGNGDASVKTNTQAFWLDAAWAWRPTWTLAARVERLVPTNELNGTGVQPLAREAGWQGSGLVDRFTAALEHELSDSLKLSLEAGREHDPEDHVSHLALRLVWSAPQQLGAAW